MNIPTDGSTKKRCGNSYTSNNQKKRSKKTNNHFSSPASAAVSGYAIGLCFNEEEIISIDSTNTSVSECSNNEVDTATSVKSIPSHIEVDTTSASCYSENDSSSLKSTSAKPFRQLQNQRQLSHHNLYKAMSERDTNNCIQKYGNDRTVYHEPQKVTKSNVNDEKFLLLKSIAVNNIFLVFEETQIPNTKQPGNKEPLLDHDRWKNRNICALHAIRMPTKPETRQVYMISDASEVHYECLGQELFTAIELTSMVMYLYDTDKSYSSNHCLVNNDQNELEPFFKRIDFQSVDRLLIKYPSQPTKRLQESTCSFGLCGKLVQPSFFIIL